MLIKNFYIIKQKLLTLPEGDLFFAEQIQSKKNVIIKVSTNNLINEFNLGKKLNVNYIQNNEYKEFEKSIIEMPCDHMKILSDFIPKDGIKINDFFKISYKLLDLIESFHSKRFILNFLHPSTILIDYDTFDIKIIDWSFVTEFGYAINQQMNLSHIYTFPEYIAPEQTGRLPNSIDYRTDFYLLGILLYQLFTGSTPFKDSDPFQTVYQQIAISPPPLSNVNQNEKNISNIIQDIIFKLLAKNPDDRYYSTLGIKNDLKKTETFYKYGIAHVFELGKTDISPIFYIPEKVYDREEEKEILEKTYLNSLENELNTVFVTGYSGVGKTSLINELRKTVSIKNGYFINGKFDLLSKTIPYRGISEAFGKLCKIILSEPQNRLDNWKKSILEVVGNNGQILIDLIPELELIIGPQPKIRDLSIEARHNIFKWIFIKFVNVFTENNSLVLILEDLQWVDIQTLDLIKNIITFKSDQKFMLIGSYRNNEVGFEHPFRIFLDNLAEEKINTINIELKNLPMEYINQLCADTLHKSPEKVNDLSKIVEQKTGGNPFFIKLFLNNLYKNNLIKYSEQNQWEWDMEEISYQTTTENVVDISKNIINEFQDHTRQIVTTGSCIGNTFSKQELSAILESIDIDKEIRPAIEFGILIYRENQYSFSHDRFQEAAYNLINKEERPKKHLEIARHLYKLYLETKDETLLFKTVEQYNRGIDLLTQIDEKILLIELNVKAASKAKIGQAYSIALQYLESVLPLFSTENINSHELWNQHYNLMLDFYNEYSELLYLNQRFEESEKIINNTLPLIQNILDKSKLKHILMKQLLIKNDNKNALNVAIDILHDLNIDFPYENYEKPLESELALNKKLMANRSISSILDLPEMTNPEYIFALKILNDMETPAYFSASYIWRFIAVKAINITLQHGLIPEAPFFYLCFGIFLNSTYQKYNESYEYGKMALKLSGKSGNLAQIGRDLHVMAEFIVFWLRHLRHTLKLAHKSHNYSYQVGDLLWMSFTQVHFLVETFILGDIIQEILEKAPEMRDFAKKANLTMQFHCVTGIMMAQLNLTGKTLNRYTFNNDEMDEDHFLQICQNPHALGFYFVFKSQIHYYYEDFKGAFKWSEKAGEIISFMEGQPITFEFVFYQALILIELYLSSDKITQKKYKEIIEKHLAQLEIWNNHCPDNFQHRFLIVRAEYKNKIQDNQNIIDDYELAIETAEKTGYIQIQALASELYAKFWLRRNNHNFAKIYFKKAKELYEKWGAKRKVECLEEFYSEMFVLSEKVSLGRLKLGKVLDANTIINATYVLAEEHNIEELISKMLKIISKNTEVQKSIFIYQKNINDYLLTTFHSDQDVADIKHIKNIQANKEFPSNILNYVFRTGLLVSLETAQKDNLFINDLYFEENNPKSIFCIPIKKQDKIYGVLYLENKYIEKAFNQIRIEFINIILAQCVISIENSKLLELEKQNVARETLIRKIIETIRSSLDIEEVLAFICEETAKIFNVQRSAITMFPEPQNFEIFVLKKEYKSEPNIKGFLDASEFSKIATIWGEILIKSKKVLAFDNIIESDTPDYFKNSYSEIGVKSLIGTAIRKGEEAWGTLVLSEYNEPRHWSEEDKTLLETIADQVYIAINQAELYEKEKLAAEREKISKNIIEILRSTLDKNIIKNLFVKNISKFFNADRVLLSEYDAEKKIYLPVDKNAEVLSSPSEQSLVGYEWTKPEVAEFIQPLLEKREINIFSWKEYIKQNPKGQDFIDFFEGYDIKSSYNFPIIYQQNIMGFFCIDFMHEPRKLSDEEINRLRNISSQAGIALYHADLYLKAQQTAVSNKKFISEFLDKIKTPTNNILYKISTLLENEFERAAQLEYLNNIMVSCNELLELTKKFSNN